MVKITLLVGQNVYRCVILQWPPTSSSAGSKEYIGADEEADGNKKPKDRRKVLFSADNNQIGFMRSHENKFSRPEEHILDVY